jgi:hypothetical protein
MLFILERFVYSKSLALGAFDQEERSHHYCSGCSTTTPNLPTPRVTAAIPARTVEWQQQLISGMPKQLECVFGRNGIFAHFRVFFAFRAVSFLILLFKMRKQQENRIQLPLNTSNIHVSAFLVPERPIAEF